MTKKEKQEQIGHILKAYENGYLTQKELEEKFRIMKIWELKQKMDKSVKDRKFK